MAKRVDLKSMSADAVFCYTWSHTPEDERLILCVLADLSTEAMYCRWHELQSFERVALRASMARVIEQHYRSAWQRALKTTRPPSGDMTPPEGITHEAVSEQGPAIGPAPSVKVTA